MRKKTWLIIVLVICQLLVLAGMAGIRYYTKANGKDIVLLTAPANFNEMRYENTIYLSYTASSISWEKWSGKQRPEQGDKVYVLFQKSGNVYEPVRVTKEKIASSNDTEAILAGKYQYESDGTMHISYGLERYRFKQNESLKSGERQWKVHVKVSDYHQFITKIEP